MNTKLILGLLLLLSFAARGQKTASHVKKSHGRIIQVHQTCTEYFEDGWWDFVKCDEFGFLQSENPEKPGEWVVMDVPAVHQCTTKIPGWMVCPEYRLTCADKSRVLLTSEDGQKWCHKVASQVVNLTNSQ